MNLFVAAGLIIVLIVLLILGYIWYQKQAEEKDKCNSEDTTLPVTFFSMKMQRLQQRLKIIKHQIRCLEEE